MTERSLRLITYYLVLYVMSQTASSTIFEKSCVKPEKRVCINVGGEFETIGKYMAEPDAITVAARRGYLRILHANGKIHGTSVYHHSRAFAVQRINESPFYLEAYVPSNYRYNIKFGTAEIKHCEGSGNMINITVNGRRRIQMNPYMRKGCRTAYFKKMYDLRAKRLGILRVLKVHVSGSKLAALATMCVYRTKIPPPCSPETGCFKHEGKVNSVSIHGSFVGPDFMKCVPLPASQSRLTIPSGAIIKQALLSWASLGDIYDKTYITFNGNDVSSDTFHSVPYGHFVGQANVTKYIESGSTVQNVSNIHLDWPSGCEDYLKISGWSLTVIYEDDSLSMNTIQLYSRSEFHHMKITNIPKLANEKSFLVVNGYGNQYRDPSPRQGLKINGVNMREPWFEKFDEEYGLESFNTSLAKWMARGERNLLLKRSWTLFLTAIIHVFE